MSNRGKFIVFEGCEGSGKSSAIKYLKQMLSAKKDVVFTREPGGTEVGEAIRDVLMDKNLCMESLTEIFLFCAARAQHIKELIEPMLNNGINVICDRFSYSTRAYQLYGNEREDLSRSFESLNNRATGGLTADFVIYLDVDPEVGLKRKASSSDGICTRFDEKDIEFHKRVRKGFVKQMSSGGCERWHFVGTTHLTEEKVKEYILSLINNILDSS